jgi:hypothetical protein
MPIKVLNFACLIVARLFNNNFFITCWNKWENKWRQRGKSLLYLICEQHKSETFEQHEKRIFLRVIVCAISLILFHFKFSRYRFQFSIFFYIFILYFFSFSHSIIIIASSPSSHSPRKMHEKNRFQEGIFVVVRGGEVDSSRAHNEKVNLFKSRGGILKMSFPNRAHMRTHIFIIAHFKSFIL